MQTIICVYCYKQVKSLKNCNPSTEKKIIRKTHAIKKNLTTFILNDPSTIIKVVKREHGGGPSDIHTYIQVPTHIPS